MTALPMVMLLLAAAGLGQGAWAWGQGILALRQGPMPLARQYFPLNNTFPPTGAQSPPPPLRIVLLVDTSDSMTNHVPLRRGDRTRLTDAAAGLATALRADETASLATFGPTVNVGPAVLRRDEVERAAGALGEKTGGASPLWDALDAAIHSLADAAGRRAIVVVTDGRTTGNLLSFSEILQRLQQAGVPVSFICAERPKDARVADPSVRLRQIAAATGGQYYAIANHAGMALRKPKPEEIRRAIDQALDAVRKGGAI